MSDEFEDPPPVPDDCQGCKLETLRDVRKAIGAACRLLKAGKLGPQTGGVLMNGYMTLAKLLQDQRDSVWTKRAAVLWEERGKNPTQSQPPESH